jgi:ACR3 family arsenite transporter
MLLATFLQVPLAELRRALANLHFLAGLLPANFSVIPLVVAILFQFVPPPPVALSARCRVPRETPGAALLLPR